LADQFALAAGGATATVSAAGAELLRWSAGGRDLLWRPDRRFWAQTCPILFPVVGRSTRDRVAVCGSLYPMPLHGFAARRPFQIVEAAADRVVLRLVDDAQTRKLYPFSFMLDVTFRLQPIQLSVEFEVTNTGTATQPYALGFHPGFARSAAACIVFEADEDPTVPEIAPGGLLSHRRRQVPLADRALAVADSLLSQGALCFLDAKSRWLRLEQRDGSSITLAAAGFRHWAVWGKPGAPFICLEAWTGHADFETDSGELAERPSMRLLPPGGSAVHRLRMVAQSPRERFHGA